MESSYFGGIILAAIDSYTSHAITQSICGLFHYYFEIWYCTCDIQTNQTTGMHSQGPCTG